MDKLIEIIKKLMIQFVFLLFSSVALHAQDLTKIFASGKAAFAQGNIMSQKNSLVRSLEKIPITIRFSVLKRIRK